MNMEPITKKQMKHLRELAGIGYERDLERCMSVLYEQFEKWKQKEISVWDLNEKIHKFHNQIARDLYKSYTINDPIFPVVFGIKSGVLSIDEVQQECRPEIEELLKSLDSELTD